MTSVAQLLLQRLDALLTLGVRVPVKAEGLRYLATIPPIGDEILAKCLEVLEEANPARQYWPLMDLIMVKRAIAEQCFPEAPCSVPGHMASPPDWLADAPVVYPACHSKASRQ